MLLIAFAGLPGTGKTTIAREVARRLGALYLRADSIEQAIRDSGVVPGSLNDAGYRAAYAVAGDNLALGRSVVADSVNPWMLTRDAFRAVGHRAAASVLEIEIVCSDPNEHRRRVETRISDVPGLDLPNWLAVINRDYRPWERERTVIDTAARSEQACIAEVLAAVSNAYGS